MHSFKFGIVSILLHILNRPSGAISCSSRFSRVLTPRLRLLTYGSRNVNTTAQYYYVIDLMFCLVGRFLVEYYFLFDISFAIVDLSGHMLLFSDLTFAKNLPAGVFLFCRNRDFVTRGKIFSGNL